MWNVDPIGSHTLDLECFCQRLRKTIFAKKKNTRTYLEPVCPRFWWLNPSKQGLFQSKQGSFGFQVHKVPTGQNAFAGDKLLFFGSPKKRAKGKTVGICQVTYLFKLQSKPPEINSSRSTPREIQENTGVNGDFCWYDFRVQSYPKGQLGVPLTVYPWYLLRFFRDSWGL